MGRKQAAGNISADINKLAEMLKEMAGDTEDEENTATYPEMTYEEALTQKVGETKDALAVLGESIRWIDETFFGDWWHFPMADGVCIRLLTCTVEFAERIKLKNRFPADTKFFSGIWTDEPGIVMFIYTTGENRDGWQEVIMKVCDSIKRGGDGTEWDIVKWLTEK